MHILKALHQNGTGHLWGIEFDRSIYDRMVANIRSAIPEAADRFSPLFGNSVEVLPGWLRELPAGATVDFAFLDGGDHPGEQVAEFDILDPVMPVGSELMAHDALMRKGCWFVPYLQALDHWDCEMLRLSEVGLLRARKVAEKPSQASRVQAQAILRKRKNEFKEVVARLLPAKVRKWVAAILPGALMRRLMRNTPG